MFSWADVECPLKPPCRTWSGQQRTFSGYYRAFFRPAIHSGLQRKLAGQFRAAHSLTRAPQSGTGLPLADKMPSWAKGALFDQKRPSQGSKGNFRASIGTSKAKRSPSYQKRVISGRQRVLLGGQRASQANTMPSQAERWLFSA